MDSGGPERIVPASAPGSQSPLRIVVTSLGDCWLVTAVGEVDLSNTHHLHAALSMGLRPDRPLIADLSALRFLDSRGLRTLVMNQRNADLQGARLLIAPSPDIAALITLGNADALSIHPSLDAALTAARQPAAPPAGQSPPALTT